MNLIDLPIGTKVKFWCYADGVYKTAFFQNILEGGGGNVAVVIVEEIGIRRNIHVSNMDVIEEK